MNSLRALTLASVSVYCLTLSAITFSDYVSRDAPRCWTTTTDGQATITCTAEGPAK